MSIGYNHRVSGRTGQELHPLQGGQAATKSSKGNPVKARKWEIASLALLVLAYGIGESAFGVEAYDVLNEIGPFLLVITLIAGASGWFNLKETRSGPRCFGFEL
jgi:hypothetical protein